MISVQYLVTPMRQDPGLHTGQAQSSFRLARDLWRPPSRSEPMTMVSRIMVGSTNVAPTLINNNSEADATSTPGLLQEARMDFSWDQAVYQCTTFSRHTNLRHGGLYKMDASSTLWNSPLSHGTRRPLTWNSITSTRGARRMTCESRIFSSMECHSHGFFFTDQVIPWFLKLRQQQYRCHRPPGKSALKIDPEGLLRGP